LTLLEMRNDVPPSVNVAFDATYLRLVAGVAGSTKRANDVQSADVFALMDACSRLEAPGLAQSRIDALMGVVRARMATYGMTPTQLAVRLGVSTQTVKAWLAGQACMRAQSVWMMCEALGIEIEVKG
jgi:DNA-binding transcriptional regulator YiaG